MLFATSLRLRLLVLILLPLMVVASLAIGWQYRQSRQSAEAVFDQKLSILALAVFRDLLATQGENLSPSTKALFEEASGATFFYHVSGPDGGFVNGYSPPPIAPDATSLPLGELAFFDATFRGEPVTVVRLQERARVDQLTGTIVVSVWQNQEERAAFARNLAMRGAVVVIALILTVCAVVFFGIRTGLRPLSALDGAITSRSSSDLSPIMRTVPHEVRHIVDRLNHLFAEVTEAQAEKDKFISDAAHQLRNPIAAMTSMAEVAQKAKTLPDAKARMTSLAAAARDLSHLTEQMLSYERLQHHELRKVTTHIDGFLADVAMPLAQRALAQNCQFAFEPGAGDLALPIDDMMMAQAITNLVDNALKHGGEELGLIQLSSQLVPDSEGAGTALHIIVGNDGAPLSVADSERLFERFVQGHEGEGTGLGLAIVSQVARQHEGHITFEDQEGLRCFILSLPI